MTLQPSVSPAHNGDGYFLGLAAASPVGMAAWTPGGRLLRVNDAFLALLDYSRAQFGESGMDWASMTSPDFHPADQRAAAQVEAGGQSEPYEKDLLGRLGERVAISVTLVHFEEGGQPCLLGYLHDLRPHRAADRLASEALADTARQLDEERAALEAFIAFTEAVGSGMDRLQLIREAIGLLQETRAVDVTYFERDGDLLRIRLLVENFPPALLARAQQGFSQELPGFVRAAQEHAAVFINGWDTRPLGVPEATPFHAAAFQPFFQGAGLSGMLVMASRTSDHWTARDQGIFRAVGRSLTLALEHAELREGLTAQRHVLDARTRALETANEELNDFTSSISHDLRTPLRHIQGFSTLLRQAAGPQLDVKAARYLTVVAEAATQMDTLLDALLHLSHGTRVPLRPGPVNLGALVAAVCAELTSAAGAPPDNHRIEWIVGPLPTVTGDPDKLRVVLTQLLANALKYSRTRDVSLIEVWAEEHPDEWVVVVKDNGVGFDPRYKDRLFGLFQRLHPARDFEGLGVGLANVRRIVARHGGRVWGHGAPGKGATFSFTLPRTR